MKVGQTQSFHPIWNQSLVVLSACGRIRNCLKRRWPLLRYLHKNLTLRNKIEPDMTLPSPCVGQCKLNDEDVCVGCNRTLVEIVNWQGYTEQQRAAVLQRLSELTHLQN
ncbi:DUF1289 domain-containing protein [Alteromonas sp. D210916BOD_24]|uniref:DUF1289 domain-containing protein n=1 Tax=Alteromonas sp. D210916BOD_24 TaxID=3157618 RepID=UPI00399D464A